MVGAATAGRDGWAGLALESLRSSLWAGPEEGNGGTRELGCHDHENFVNPDGVGEWLGAGGCSGVVSLEEQEKLVQEDS